MHGPARSPVVVGRVLFGADQAVAEFVRARIPSAQEHGFGPCSALGVVNAKGALIGGVVFNMFRGHDCVMSGAFDDPRWCSRTTLRTLFEVPFKQFGCIRLTTITARNNKRARKIDEKLGFKLEGVARKGYDGKQDAIIFGMLKEDCVWLRPSSPRFDRRNGGNGDAIIARERDTGRPFA